MFGCRARLAAERVWPAALRANTGVQGGGSMIPGVTKSRARRVGYLSRHGSSSRGLATLARAGLAARGVMYIIIGCIALQIAFGHGAGRQTGAGRCGWSRTHRS